MCLVFCKFCFSIYYCEWNWQKCVQWCNERIYRTFLTIFFRKFGILSFLPEIVVLRLIEKFAHFVWATLDILFANFFGFSLVKLRLIIFFQIFRFFFRKFSDLFFSKIFRSFFFENFQIFFFRKFSDFFFENCQNLFQKFSDLFFLRKFSDFFQKFLGLIPKLFRFFLSKNFRSFFAIFLKIFFENFQMFFFKNCQIFCSENVYIFFENFQIFSAFFLWIFIFEIFFSVIRGCLDVIMFAIMRFCQLIWTDFGIWKCYLFVLQLYFLLLIRRKYNYLYRKLFPEIIYRKLLYLKFFSDKFLLTKMSGYVRKRSDFCITFWYNGCRNLGTIFDHFLTFKIKKIVTLNSTN